MDEDDEVVGVNLNHKDRLKKFKRRSEEGGGSDIISGTELSMFLKERYASAASEKDYLICLFYFIP